MNTDRNLLFGALAVQADLIDAQQFARACALWAADKERSLADILVEQGWLTAEDRADVERLVRRKLQKHNGDVQASLAEATTDGVRPSIVALTRLEQGEPVANTTAYAPTTRDRYLLARLHATGGLGRVWLARDDSLGREVALKELRPDRAGHPAVCGRFLREAKITGQLEHPGIVPVYELALPDGGEPFYTMRFVRGQTLGAAIAAYHSNRQRGQAQALDLRKLLDAFLGVCHAVAYAHSRGVIHRDLKPQNVVKGDFGEVIVLDWGLAKLLADAEPADLPPVAVGESDGLQTVQGQVLGTPAYMPPEQAEGRLQQMDARSDVYGLGAILYELLTGRPPFAGNDTTAILRQVIHDAPTRPREIATVPVALEAVCLKALAKKSSDRYATVEALADDVRHWLADEPVSVCREPLGVRAGRWARRHRTLVASAAALLVTAVIGLSVGTVLLRQANRETARQRDLANDQREKAQANFVKARSAVDEMLTRVANESLAEVPLMEGVRVELLEAALDFYRGFRAQASDDPEVWFETGRAHGRVADLYALLGKANDAEPAYREGIAVFNAMIEARPEATGARLEMSRLHNNLANLFRQTGRFDRARDEYLAAVAISEQLVKDYPRNADCRHMLATQYINLGNILDDRDRHDEAEKCVRQAIEQFERLVKEHEEELSYQVGLGNAWVHLGAKLESVGLRTEAEAWYRKALASARKLDDSGQDCRALWSWAADRVGQVMANTGRHRDAVAPYREALRIRQQLVADYPAILGYRKELAATYNNLGGSLRDSGQMKESEEVLSESIAIQSKLVAQLPRAPQFREYLAVGLYNRGKLHRATNKLDRAEEDYKQAKDILDKLLTDHPGKPKYQTLLGTTMNNLALLVWPRGELKEARALLERAVTLQTSALATNPRHPTALDDLRKHHANLAEVLLAMNDHAGATRSANKLAAYFPDNALDAYNAARCFAGCAPLAARDQRLSVADRSGVADRYALRSIQLLRESFQRGREDLTETLKDTRFGPLHKHPRFGPALAGVEMWASEHLVTVARQRVAAKPTEEARDRLADRLQEQGSMAFDRDQHDRAEPAWREAHTVWAKLAAEQPGKDGYRSRVAGMLNNLALMYSQQAKWKEAESAQREALQTQRLLARDHPKIPRYALDLAGSHVNLGQLLAGREKRDEALVEFDQAVTLLQTAMRDGEKHPTARLFLRNAYWGRAELHGRAGKYDRAAKDWHGAAEMETGQYKNGFTLYAAIATARTGDHASAAKAGEALAKLPTLPATSLFEMARLYALCATAAKEDKDTSERHATESVALLKRAAEAGHFKQAVKRAALEADADFAGLRERADYKKWLTELPESR